MIQWELSSCTSLMFVSLLVDVFVCRVEVPPRKGSRKVEAVGIFPGATVIRGPDWQWGNQDGE